VTISSSTPDLASTGRDRRPSRSAAFCSRHSKSEIAKTIAIRILPACFMFVVRVGMRRQASDKGESGAFDQAHIEGWSSWCAYCFR